MEMKLQEVIEGFTAYAVQLLGERLKGIIIVGSAARPWEFTPLSDVNIIVFATELSSREKLELSSLYSSRVFPIFLRVEEYNDLLGKGHLLAHAVFKDSRIIVADDELVKLVSKRPPITNYTLECLFRRSLACASSAVRCLYLGLRDSTTYAFRALKNAAIYSKLRHDGQLVFTESNVSEYLEAVKAPVADVFNRLATHRVEARPLDLALLDEAIVSVALLLDIQALRWGEVLKKLVEAGSVMLSDVQLLCEEGMMKWIVDYLNAEGELGRIIVP